MQEIPVFFSWAGVALVTLLPIINAVSTAVFLRSMSSISAGKSGIVKSYGRALTWPLFRSRSPLAAHLIMIAFGIVIPGM